ncbi:MAG: hypothetical protein HWN67_15360, partial [Candidatus Helarchaeota archaeon]|nr:hypothetical protein [Candidatus Helarchaeota archaeon]
NPGGISIDEDGYIYVADSGNDRIVIFSESGYILNFSKWGSSAEDQFGFPDDLEVILNQENQTHLYVVDKDNDRVVKFRILKDENKNIIQIGLPTKIIEGYELNEQFFTFEELCGITVNSFDSIFVSDKGNKSIIKFGSDGSFELKIGGTDADDVHTLDGIATDSRNFLYIVNNDPVSEKNELKIMTETFIMIQEIEINADPLYDVCIDDFDNILVLANGSIFKLRYLDDFLTHMENTTLNLTLKYQDCWENFENDTIGEHPDTNWITYEPTNTKVKILNEKYDNNSVYFKKVVKLEDNSGAAPCTIEHDTGWTSWTGAIYFNLYIPSSIQGEGVRFMTKNYGALRFILQFSPTGNIHYASNIQGELLYVGSYPTNCFNTFKIEFNSSTFSVKIRENNGWTTLNSGLIYTGSISSFAFYTGNNYVTGEMYIPAVDYSWASGYYEDRILNQKFINYPIKSPIFDKDGNRYTIEENLIHKFDNYGKYLATFDPGVKGIGTDIKIKNFENSSYLYHALHDDNGPEHVVKYSLDGEKITQINITDYDNLSSISIDDEKSIYGLTNSGISKFGHYTAKFSFTNDPVGSDPIDWEVFEYESGNVTIIGEKDGHKKVCEIKEEGFPGIVLCENDFQDRLNGTVELYYHYNNLSGNNHYIMIVEEDIGNDGIKLEIKNGYLYYHNNDSSWPQISNISVDYWHHFRVIFNISSGWHLYLNDIRYPAVGDYGLYNHSGQLSKIDNICFGPTPSIVQTIYIDAVDFSWADGYYEGRNKVDFYDANGEISSEGLKNQIDIDSLGNLYYLSHSTNEILKIDWVAKEISERWPIDQNLTEHQLVIDRKDNFYLLNKFNGQGQILSLNNRSEVLSSYNFSYNPTDDIITAVDYFRDFYIFKISDSSTILNKFGRMEPPPELSFQLTDEDSWRDVAINFTGHFFTLNLDNEIKIYNSSHFYIETLTGSGLVSPTAIEIDGDNRLVILDSNIIKVYDYNTSTFNPIIDDQNLEIIDFYLSSTGGYEYPNRVFLIGKDQNSNYFLRCYNYSDSSAQLINSTQMPFLELPTSICVMNEEGKDRIYISDYLKNKIFKLNESHQLEREWGRLGSMPGEFLGSFQVINDYNCNIYVLDVGNSRIQKFDSNGNFKSEWGDFKWTLAENMFESKIALSYNQFLKTDLLILDSLKLDIYHYEFVINNEFELEGQTYTREKVIDGGVIYGIPVIYAIIYDPPGRDSYGYIEENTEFEITWDYRWEHIYGWEYGFIWDTHTTAGGIAVGTGLNIESDIIWTKGMGASENLVGKIKTSRRITSSQSSNNKYIGPGRGDTIWGEIYTRYFYIIERTTFNSKGEIINVSRIEDSCIYRDNKFIITITEALNIFNSTIAPILTENKETKDIAYDNYIDDDEMQYVSPVGDYLLFGDGNSYQYDTTNVDSVKISTLYNKILSSRTATKIGFETINKVKSFSGSDVTQLFSFSMKIQNIIGRVNKNDFKRIINEEKIDESCIGFTFSDESSKNPT